MIFRLLNLVGIEQVKGVEIDPVTQARGNPGGKEITMDEIKLKPCPFCGGKGVEILEDGNKYLYYRYMAQCQKCGANAKLSRTKEEARKAWNRRAEHE